MPNKLKKYKKLDVINSQTASCQIDIGESNVNSWNHLKVKLNFKRDSDFVECLLSIAEKYLCSKLIISYKGKRVDDDDSNSSDGVGGKIETTDDDEIDNSHDVENSTEKQSNFRSATPEKTSTDDGPVDVVSEAPVANRVADRAEEVVKTGDNEAKNSKDCDTKKGKRKPKSRDAAKKKKSPSDEPTLQSYSTEHNSSCQKETDKINEQLEKSVIPDSCCFCEAVHSKENCPLQQSFDNFKMARDSIVNVAHSGEDRAKSTLPDILEMKEKHGKDSAGVFAKFPIEKHTVFGPLVGKQIKEMEIADDSSMKHIWEEIPWKIFQSLHEHHRICEFCPKSVEEETIICEGSYLSTTDPNNSNWIRWLCPAASRHDRNVVPVERGGQLFFVSTATIDAGSELVYWAEMTGAWANKKMDKTNCGGCNLQFEHAMYYRTHCAVFHEASLSLTVRKYHCKICGKAVLGKQNIMKHALLNHDGKGAYQCQFCSKFFLRLNYLEMHRNYGCSANPHRARPLCDYCGRKFCQPQKLKVHIKRMHSDLADVLHEFQCRDCLKILGSRAALQRHTKEVHKRPSGVSCSKCSKTFQNKSNLKIHMLTHSGIKPFKCQEDRCAAAFTTKQCLQFHYKKVHGLTEDRFPSIVRSVDYTFESYAGVDDGTRETDDPTSNDQGWPDESGGEGKGAEEDLPQRDDMDESLDVNDNESTVGPVCEETSVIEYHSSHSLRRTFTNALELTQPNRENQVPGVIVGGQSSNASLLVEAALESAEKELCARPEMQSPPQLPKSIPSPPGGYRFEVSHPAFPLSARLPASSILSVENLTDAPALAHDDKRPATSPGLLPGVYDSGLRQCTPPVPSPPHVTYLSPRYDRHYMSPPPPPSDYLQEEPRFHDEDIAQNLTKYAKYEEARVMYHELIPRYPPPPLPSVDYFGPWDLLRPQQPDVLRPPALPQTVGLPASVDLSVNGHLPPLERPPSPAFHQFHHIPHKSPIYHRYSSYY